MGTNGAAPRGGGLNRYLPILSLVLVAAVAASLIRGLLERSSEHGRRVQAFDRALRLITENYPGEVDAQELYQGAMHGMLRSLGDPHSAYLDAVALRKEEAQTEGAYSGIGVTLASRDGAAIILDVLEGPAREAGLEPGDVIVSVDGEPCDKLTFDRIAAKIRGKPDTTVQLGLRRAGTGKLETVSVTRARITMQNVRWEMIEPGIGYIRIRQFDKQCSENLRKAIAALQQDEQELKALLLDLRDNGGGLLNQAVEVSDLFLSKGLIASLEGRSQEDQRTYNAKQDIAVAETMPVAVLVNQGSASAAEVVAGALQGNGRAALVGTRTFGKGAVNRIYRLAREGGLFLTVAHYKVPPGRTIEGNGIEPDVVVGEMPPVPDDPEEREQWHAAYLSARQEQYRRAVDLLKDKMQ